MHTRLVIFDVADNYYALSVDVVFRIVHLPSLFTPPALPHILAGLLNLHGRLVSVVQLNRLFNLPEHSLSAYASVIILKGDGPTIGLLVDRVLDICQVADGEISPVDPGKALNDCLVGEFRKQDRTTSVLSRDRLLLEQEQIILKNFEADAARRLESFARAEDEIARPI